MKILVCTKQVPDSDAELVIDSATDRVCFAGRPAYKMNRYDAFAVEAALQIRQETAGGSVAAVSVGPQDSADVVRRALGMGVDHGILLEHRSDEHPGPGRTAATIANLIKRDRYDLVLTGTLSEDEMNGTVGSMIAAHLDWPCATNVVASKISKGNQSVQVESEIEGGQHEQLEVPLPAVLTIQSGISPPRYPKLSLMLRANQYPLDIIDIRTMGPSSRRQRLVKMDYPAGTRNSVYLSGSLEDKTEKLIQLLKRKAFLS